MPVGVGWVLGSTTGYNREMLDVLVPEARKRGYDPDSAICAADVRTGRPEPWTAFKSAMEMRVYPIEAIGKIGDALPDIEGGLNAGTWTIGVAKTSNELSLNQAEVDSLDPGMLEAKLAGIYERMYRAGAHYVVDSIASVPAILDEIGARLARGEHPTG